ncbi:hypothetical protein Ddc_00978 [Ditylenchus destructor]|nr:hypothetical protein Ddc_00978 [Ditylenchus destructor]
MLAKIPLQHLVERSKVNRALAGSLLPLNNNECFLNLEDVSSVTVVEDDPKGAVPVAFGIFNRCSPNQIYCAIVTTSPAYEANYVTVEKIKCKNSDLGLPEDSPSRNSLLKMTSAFPELPDLSGLPQYFSAFAEPALRPLLTCVIDQLIDQTVGHYNVEMKRNMTVDLYDAEAGEPEHSDVLWRDFSGFVVADRYRYSEIVISREKLMNVVSNTCDAKEISREEGSKTLFNIELMTKANQSLLVDYDQDVAVMNRQEYVEYLLGLSGIKGMIAIDSMQHQPLGYILSLNGRVLQLYAENENVASHLMFEHIKKNRKGRNTIGGEETPGTRNEDIAVEQTNEF